MPQVFDRQTGKAVPAAPDQAAEGLVSGQLALDADAGPVPLMGKDGTIYRADPSKVAGALASQAYRLLSPEEELKHTVAKEEAAKGFAGSLEQGAESLINQGLFNVPETIAEERETPEQRAHREAVQEYHQTARILGGAVGVAGSMLYGGELFKGAELAGQAVEHGILPAKALAEAGLTTKLAAKAANLATQGAIYSSPQAFTQAVMGDPKKAAETLFWGIGAGAALGGGAELIGAGLGAAVDTAEEALGSGTLREKLGDFASNRTAKAFGAERSQLNKLSDERIRGITDFAHEEGLIKPGMSRAELGDAVESAQKKYGGQIGDVINSLDGLIEKGTAKEDLVQHAIRPGEIGDRLMAELNTPELHMPMNADQRAALETIRESANRIPTTKINGRDVVSFEDAQDFVSSLRKKWVSSVSKAMNEGGVKGVDAVTPLDAMKSAAYQVARDTVHQAGDRVAIAANEPSLTGALAAAKEKYAKVAELEKWVSTRERQEAGNRMIGLTDMIHMGHGPLSAASQAIGGAIGGVLGGIPGADVGAMVGKVPGMALDLLAKHWMEDKGLVYLSTIARRAAKEGPAVFSAVMASEGNKRLEATMGQVRETVQRLAQRGIQDTGERTREHMGHLLGSTQGLSKEQQFAKLSGRLTSLASNPAAMGSVTSALSAPFAAASPELGDAYQQQLTQTLTYLYSALPKNTNAPLPFAPNDWQPSRSQLIDFHDKAEIVANPMKLMQHVERGTLSDAHMEAAATVYPQVLAMMRNEVLGFAASHPDVLLPRAERRSISRLLGMPLDPMEQQPALGALQASYASAGPTNPNPTGQKMPKGKIRDLPGQETTFGATTHAEAA